MTTNVSWFDAASRTFSTLVLGILLHQVRPVVNAFPVVVNGNFESGNLNGWTTFLTTDGILNQSVTGFDTDDDGTSNFAARFKVGRTSGGASNAPQAGGGIAQSLYFDAAGVYRFSADIAVYGYNSQRGAFTMLVDESPVAHWDFGQNFSGSVSAFSSLVGTVSLGVGTHELKFLVTRSFLWSPSQYIDDVSVEALQLQTVPDQGRILTIMPV